MSLALALPALPGVNAWISRRHQGLSEAPFASLNLGLNTIDNPQRVIQNRRALYASLDLDLGRAIFLEQVHGDTVLQVDASHAGRGALDLADALPQADAMITLERGLILNIGVADCLAVVLTDEQGRGLGVAHAGWRGALAGLPAKTGQALAAALGVETSQLRASLSACLGPCHLQLSGLEHTAFVAVWPHEHVWASPLLGGHFQLDLWGQVRAQLEGIGIQASSIAEQRLCTWCQEDDFFSFRRDQGNTGRMLVVASLK